MFTDKRWPLLPPERALLALLAGPPLPFYPPTARRFCVEVSLMFIRVALVDSVARAALLPSLRLDGDMRENRVDLSSSTVYEPNKGLLITLGFWSGARLLLPVKIPEMLLLFTTCLGTIY